MQGPNYGSANNLHSCWSVHTFSSIVVKQFVIQVLTETLVAKLILEMQKNKFRSNLSLPFGGPFKVVGLAAGQK